MNHLLWKGKWFSSFATHASKGNTDILYTDKRLFINDKMLNRQTVKMCTSSSLGAKILTMVEESLCVKARVFAVQHSSVYLYRTLSLQLWLVQKHMFRKNHMQFLLSDGVLWKRQWSKLLRYSWFPLTHMFFCISYSKMSVFSLHCHVENHIRL